MKISTLTLKSSVLVSVFIFSVASMGIVQAKECDMPDEIAAGNSAAVRDDCPEQGGAQEKKRQKKTNGRNTPTQDKSRFSTDGTEGHYLYDIPKDYNGTGPKREGRY